MAPSRKEQLAANMPQLRRPTISEATDALLAPDPQPRAIVPAADGKSMQFKQFRLTPVGMLVATTATLDDWKAAGEFFKLVEVGRNWWVGDWLNASKLEWGQTYDLAEEITGFTKDTLSDIAGVCGKIELPLRNGNLDFSIHRVVARLPPEKQTYYLALAEKEKLSVVRLRQQIERDENPNPPVVVEQSPLLDKSHQKIFRRLWKGLDAGDATKISRKDIAHIRDWLTAIEVELDNYEAQTATDDDSATNGA